VRPVTVLVILLTLAAGSLAGQRQPIRHQAESTVNLTPASADCGSQVTIVNRAYRTAFLLDTAGNSHDILLAEEVTSKGCLHSEGLESTVRVTAWIDPARSESRPAWTASAKGEVGEVEGDFYRVTAHGCCDVEDAYSYFSLLTGRLVAVSSRPILSVEAPNTPFRRVFGVLDESSAVPLAPPVMAANAAAFVWYGPRIGPGSRVAIVPEDSSYYRLAAMRFISRDLKPDESDLTLWSHNQEKTPDALSDFSLVIDLAEESGDERLLHVEIPVSRDRLDLKAAVVPKGVQLVPLGAQ